MPVHVQAPYRELEGCVLYSAADDAGEPLPGLRVAVVGLVHGNETVGHLTLDRLARQLPEQLTCGEVLAVRANLAGFEAGLRHTEDGRDMNRLWDRYRLEVLRKADPDTLCYEERRVRELAPLLLECDCVLDLHSTSRPAPPFLVFRDDQRHAAMAAQLGVQHLVTGLHEQAMLDGGVCSDVGLLPGEAAERMGFTLEAGQHTDPGNLEKAWGVVVRLLSGLGMWRSPVPRIEREPEVYEVVDRVKQGPLEAEPWRFVGFVGGEEGSTRRGVPRTLASFEDVEPGELVLRRGSTGALRAVTPFTMLMPAPTAPSGDDLYYVTHRRQGVATPDGLRSHDAARREARAVERMLDQLMVDSHSQGTTWTSFDPRQCLDLCADMIGQLTRLPIHHPHRKLTLIGRGAMGVDASDHRVGSRYRHAVQRVVNEGMDIDRLQIMRGATLRWLEALTSSGMDEIMQRRVRRRQGRGQRGAGIRMFLSTAQPATVSAFVAGDLARALEEKDFESVRVGLLIEAATVEPDGPGVHVRVVRAGVFSAREEILKAVLRLQRALELEHRDLMGRPPLADQPELLDLTGPAGVLLPRPGKGTREALRRALMSLQLQLWEDRLLECGVRRTYLENDRELGLWLAETMAGTGILDQRALTRLLVERDGSGYRVELERLAEARAQGVVPPSEPRRLRRWIAPPAPLTADDVDADNLPRWLSWKRFLQLTPKVPGDRGRDVALTLHEGPARRIISGWLREVRNSAVLPDQVLVVIAGDGMSPQRGLPVQAWNLLEAHRDVCRDPRVRFLRIQHLQGTSVAWCKDLLTDFAARPPGWAPAGLCWEVEHGASVNVVLICSRLPGTRDEDGWSLENWQVDRCGVVVSDVDGNIQTSEKVGLFTERSPRFFGGNLELLEFGRTHCQRLMDQGRIALDHHADPLVAQLASWIEALRRPSPGRRPLSELDLPRAAAQVTRRLRLADPDLALGLAQRAMGSGDAHALAADLFAAVPAWPGPLWAYRLPE